MTDIQEAGGEGEQIVWGIKLPRSERGIFVTNQRLVAIDFVKWMTDSTTDEARKAPVGPSDLSKYKLFEARNVDVLDIQLNAAGRFRSGSMSVRTRDGVMEFVQKIYADDGYFEELRAILKQVYPDRLLVVGKTPTSASERIPEWVRWAVPAALLLSAAVYFYLAYLGIVSFM
jgi:hypothetical protein